MLVNRALKAIPAHNIVAAIVKRSPIRHVARPSDESKNTQITTSIVITSKSIHILVRPSFDKRKWALMASQIGIV